MSQENKYFVVVAPGLEAICAGEMERLNLPVLDRELGGLSFSGGLRELYLANLWLRSASRILVRLGEFTVRDFPALYKQLVKLPWGRFVKPGSRCRCRVSTQHSRLVHSGRIAETCEEAVLKALGLAAYDEHMAETSVYIRIVDDRCMVSIDSSGEHLHRRGYMLARGAAPLRETLAAACLLAAGYDGSQPLYDLMCGSGTLAIEGALIARRRAPGLNRCFAFMDWPKYRPGLWQLLKDEAARGEVSMAASLVALDSNPKVVEALSANLKTAGLDGDVNVFCQQLQKFEPEHQKGMLISNPPYGDRLGKDADLDALYRDLGRCFMTRFSGFDCLLICPDRKVLKHTELAFDRLLQFSNGGIPVVLWRKPVRSGKDSG